MDWADLPCPEQPEMKTLIIVVVGLAAYSTGAVRARRRSTAYHWGTATPAEVFSVALTLVLAASVRSPVSLVASVAVSAALMFLLSIVFALATRNQGVALCAGTREFEESGARPNAGVWKRWMHFSRSVVDYEFRLLLVAVYLVAIAPFALLSRNARGRKTADPLSNWVPRADSPTLEGARRPF